MSIESWKAEFMPIAARDAAADGLGPAISVSLLSWIGMREENLKKHGLRANGVQLLDDATGDELVRGVRECALCQLFFERHCRGCPLLRYKTSKCFSNGRGYHVMDNTNNPDVMIQELEGAMEDWVAKEKNWKEENT